MRRAFATHVFLVSWLQPWRGDVLVIILHAFVEGTTHIGAFLDSERYVVIGFTCKKWLWVLCLHELTVYSCL